jgi:hypothetical protein
VASYVVTAEDRDWFERCRRAWDLGALGRRGLEPAQPSPPSTRLALDRALREALAVHYFPGMWAWDRGIVEPLALAAYERAGGPPEGLALLEAYQHWARPLDRFTPLRVEVDAYVHVPDPTRPAANLLAGDGAPVRYHDRIGMVVVDDGRRHWLAEHRVVDTLAEPDELALDERGVVACWAWEQIELSTTVRGVLYTELRLDPPEFRRTVLRRSRPEKRAAAGRLGRAVAEMLDPKVRLDPTPVWAHCSRCPFRPPCLACNRDEDAEALLAEQYRARPPDVLEEGRLGGVSWGMGRGAAPPHLGRRRSPPDPR